MDMYVDDRSENVSPDIVQHAILRDTKGEREECTKLKKEVTVC